MRTTRMEVHHKCRLVDLCRVCGCKLHRGVKAKGKAVKPEPSYSCISYADKLLVAFDINVAVDAAEIHPQKFCTLCFKAMSRVLVAKEQKNHVKCYVQLYNWHLHSASTCKVCKWFLVHVPPTHSMQIHRGVRHSTAPDGTAHHRPS